MNYVKGLDTLRAFAVLFVIVSHWGTFFPYNSGNDLALRMILPSGQFGVTLFFVLSGFLITSILLSERYKYQAEGGHRGSVIKSFFVRRSLRIFPIYYLTLFLLLAAGMPYLRSHAAYFLLYMGNLLPYRENEVNPLVHLWSLGVEEQFYLVWPWVILFIREKFLKHIFIWAIVIGVVSKYIVLYLCGSDILL